MCATYFDAIDLFDSFIFLLLARLKFPLFPLLNSHLPVRVQNAIGDVYETVQRMLGKSEENGFSSVTSAPQDEKAKHSIADDETQHNG
ncbi:hypothetical protein CUMW_238660 [Citrus unshiu]|uniref:Uncharacterized protein n=1 Tax=Citrus unshiu TaxID=55188 RepID=A0A2H5QKG1_CITUN|nr:hypothetical protein CUMW_238660 [Citrus unshiu]